MFKKSRIHSLARRIITYTLLAGLSGGLFGVSAQKPSSISASAKNAHPGWSGVIQYRKTLSDDHSSDEKLFGRLDERERIKHNWSRNYSYVSSMIVNDLAGTGRPTTHATISFHDVHYHKVMQTELTNCHSWEPERVITAQSTDRETTSGQGEGEGHSFDLSVYDGKFNIDFTMPEIQGKFTHHTSSSYSNLCPDSTRGPSASDNDRDARIERGGNSVSGQVDPKDPDVIEGSKTWTETGSSTQKGFTYSVMWKFRRKPQPLMITDVRFLEPRYPTPSDWNEIDENGRSIDGNQIKVVATIANFGATDKTANVSFRELKENAALGDGTASATIPANGQKEVEMLWDSSGYAFQQSGTDVVLQPQRQVEVKIPDDTMQKDLTVIPRPVVVLPGFWQSAEAIKKFPEFFKAVSEHWNVWYAKTDIRKISTDNADALDQSIREIQRGVNAWHVDIVATQNGGLVGRVYVNSKMPTLFDGRPAATHLVMVGVPNTGTPCAEGLTGLSFRMNTFSLDAVSELAPDAMKRFNLLVNNTNGTKFAALAMDLKDATCFEDVRGDGFVPVDSVIWRTKIHATSKEPAGTREIMGSVHNFHQIYKWLAVPPKGDHAPDPNTLAASTPRDSRSVFRFASFDTRLEDNVTGRKPLLSKVISLKGKEMADIEIPLPAGTRLSANIFASPDVSATIWDDRNEIAGSNLAGGAESVDIIRNILIKRAFTPGKWKLRLENRSADETELAFTIYVDPGAASRQVAGLFAAM